MAKREEYINKLENQLREWNKKIDEYQVKAEGRSKKIKTRADTKMSELKAKRTELRHKLGLIKDSGEETFDQLKKDSEALWDDIKDGFSDIRNILKA